MLIKHGYVDDAISRGDEVTVSRLMCEETWLEGKPGYNGTVAQVGHIRSFRIKVMVQDGETRQEVRYLLGSGGLGLPWDLEADVIRLHFSLIVTPQIRKFQTGPKLSRASVG